MLFGDQNFQMRLVVVHADVVRGGGGNAGAGHRVRAHLQHQTKLYKNVVPDFLMKTRSGHLGVDRHLRRRLVKL